MPKGIYQVPYPVNEPVKSYAPGSPEREELQAMLAELDSKVIEIPQYIGGKAIKSGDKKAIHPPHDHQKTIAYYHAGTQEDVTAAINAALKARKAWSAMPWEQRASIFLKAADLLAGPYRAKLNAATMIGQSKNAFQAEIDAACELIDFFRFNVEYMTQIYEDQPISAEGIWNRTEYRALEGFTFAITPFNFTSIAGNLPTSMAMMGNVVVWKPSTTQIYSAEVLMELFKEAGLPDGVINMVLTRGAATAKTCIEHPEFAGVHFTGSTTVFKSIWKQIGDNITTHKYYPRIVGETGGKDFVLAHKSADYKEVATALVRGSFEFQGQKCSASSRAYIPKSMWSKVEKEMEKQLASIKMGSPEDFTNFINAVIDETSFDKCKGYIDRAKKSKDAEVVLGGNCDKSVGYFVQPTVILTTNPKYESMVEEIFGPILTVYVYDDKDWAKTLELVDTTSEYALTGAVFSKDRYAITEASKALENAAGNFYINDKPTGAVVGQQPFGGARASGTNDKAGSMMNLMRWVSVRAIKENFVPPTDYRYPFLEEEN